VARKLIAGGMVLAALIAGLVGVSASVVAADHAARVPAPAHAVAGENAKPTDTGAALDLSNWQETRDTISSSGFRR
jgi:hypothetical protein